MTIGGTTKRQTAAGIAREYRQRTGRRMSVSRIQELAKEGRLPTWRDELGRYHFTSRAVAALIARDEGRTD